MDAERTDMTRVTASFPDMKTARGAIRALEQAGIEGGDISLQGREARVAETYPDTQRRDSRVAWSLTKWSAVGGAAGLVAGLVLGAVIGFLLFGTDGRGIWVTALVMAFAGLPIGALTWVIAET